jgi:hypothetical protein
MPLSSSIFGISNQTEGENDGQGDFDFDNTVGNQVGEGTGEDQDLLIQRNELEDSVLSVDWSVGDAWTFAGVSYNGTFFLSMVPPKIKYDILI